MADLEFTAEEFAFFLARFENTPSWKSWDRVSGENGRDLITIRTTSDMAPVIRLAKGESGTFMATGFGDWGLMVCQGINELLDALAGSGTDKARVA